MATPVQTVKTATRLKTGVVGSASMDVCVPSRRYVVYIIFLFYNLYSYQRWPLVDGLKTTPCVPDITHIPRSLAITWWSLALPWNGRFLESMMVSDLPPNLSFQGTSCCGWYFWSLHQEQRILSIPTCPSNSLFFGLMTNTLGRSPCEGVVAWR